MSHDRPHPQALLAHACRAKSAFSMAAPTSRYSDSLDYESRKLYFDKLKTDYEVLPDPYSMPDDQWIDDVRKYVFVSKGPRYTKESLKAYKGL